MNNTTSKVLDKLFKQGYNTEKKILNFGIADLNGFTFTKEELGQLSAIQNACKSNKLISLLSGETERLEAEAAAKEKTQISMIPDDKDEPLSDNNDQRYNA